jgi:adenylate cyclase
VFFVSTLAIALVVVVAFALFLRSSRASILAAADALRIAAAHRIEKNVGEALGHAESALEHFEAASRAGAIEVGDDEALEADVFTLMLSDPHLEEVTFTRATLLSYDPAGEAQLAPEDRSQLSVYRSPDGRLTTRLTKQSGDGFTVWLRERPVGGALASASLVTSPAADTPDPTKHPTFSVLAAKERRGRAFWSDLHWSELDQALPKERQRVILTLQKAIEDASGRFLGVLRIGLLTSELDGIAQMRVEDGNDGDPHRVALLVVDGGGSAVHLIGRVDPSDHIAAFGDELRLVSNRPPPSLAALLSSPLVVGLDPTHPNRDGTLDVGGEPYLATLREIGGASGGTVGWFVAILVPEAHYTHELMKFERMFIVSFGATLLLVLLIGALTLGAVRRGLGKIVATTTRMRRFEFEKSDETSVFREVDDVMQDLERAKTVVRAMEKYVPVDLVRTLYASNREPKLGGELVQLSLMFTDIEGFTTLSEKLPPDVLAERLGDYLDAMTVAIEETGGTIDKFIGDAVMAMWNAPTRIDDHPKRACRAALACMKAARALYASPKWEGLPSLVTRYGLHTTKVMVGNFGASARLSYTALGDGVNLAARLEPLCKQYGVIALVSEDVYAAAKDDFVFRRMDRVAVKGKTRGIEVYELIGAIDDELPDLAPIRRYEGAFEAYLERRFDRAIELLDESPASDGPSRVLRERCRTLREHPPEPGWDGVHVASSK